MMVTQSTDKSEERLQKVLARAGVGSRRAVEAMMREGRVSVNGSPAVLGQKIGPRDVVRVDGRAVVTRAERPTYYALHKPYGVVTSASDDEGRATVVGLLDVPERVYPVGRLDVDSEGLVLLTNDGELAHRLTHPRFAIPKVYEVIVAGEATQHTLSHALRGVDLEDGLAQAAQAEIIRSGPETSVLRLALTQGRKREIRRMCEALGHPVQRLRRVAIGPLRLGDLAPGQWRRLTESEIKVLRRRAGLDAG